MTNNEAWDLYMALSKAKKVELGMSDVQFSHRAIEAVVDGEVKTVQGILSMRVVDARSGNGASHEFLGRAPLMSEIVSQAEILRDTLMSKAKAQRAEARAIRADSH